MALSSSNRAVFFDRDGVLNEDTGYLYRIEDFKWISGAPEAIAYAKEQGFHVIVATNQSGIGRGYYSEEDMHRLHTWMNDELQKRHGSRIDAFYHAPFHPQARLSAFRHENHPDRKPNPGMLLRAIQDFDLNPSQCFMVGDKPSDIIAAERSNVIGILFSGGNLLQAIRATLSSS